MKVMVFEPGFRGHYLQYAARIIRAALELGVEVTLVTSEQAAQSVEFNGHIGPLVARIGIRTSVRTHYSGQVLSYWRLRAGEFLASVKAVRPDHVIIPYADGLLPMLTLHRVLGRTGMLRHTEIEAMLLRGSFVYKAKGNTIAKALMTRFLIGTSPVQRLRVLDGVVYNHIKTKAWARKKALLAMPDFCDPLPPLSKTAARQALGIDTAGQLIVSAGAMEPRKGAIFLLEAFTKLEMFRPDVRVLLAGYIPPIVASDLQRRFKKLLDNGRLLIMDRFLSDQDLNAAIGVAEPVSAAYVDHLGTSGIVSRAVGNDRPVLTHDGGWCGQMVPQLQLGITLNPTNAMQYPLKLAQALDMVKTWKPSAAAGRLKKFWNPENFDRLSVMRLRERLSLPPEEVVHWETVMGE